MQNDVILISSMQDMNYAPCIDSSQLQSKAKDNSKTTMKKGNICIQF